MTLADHQASSRRVAVNVGISTLTLSRQLNRLTDPVNGAVPLEVSSLSETGGFLFIRPQSGFSFRGSVEAGSQIAVNGFAVRTVVNKATVNHASPGALPLFVTPPFTPFSMSGGEVVTIDQDSTVDYDATHMTDKDAAKRGWPVTPGSETLLALLDRDANGAALPRNVEHGDIASGIVDGVVIQREHVRSVHSVIQVGAP